MGHKETLYLNEQNLRLYVYFIRAVPHQRLPMNDFAKASSNFYYRGLTLIPAWVCNHIHYKVWDEITYPFLNFNGTTVEV